MRLLALAALVGALTHPATSSAPTTEREALTTAQLLSKADALLSSGQSSAALALYDEALQRDPNDYLALYRKGATHLAMGHLSPAADAFERVLGMSEYEKARLQLAKIALKTGQYGLAEERIGLFEQRMAKGGGGVDGSSAVADVRRQAKEGREGQKKAEEARKKHRWEECVDEATKAISVSLHSLELRSLRSECALAAGDIEAAAGDLSRSAQLSPHDPALSLRVALLSSLFLSPSTPIASSLAPIKACLHSDPESKPCKKWFRLIKALDKDLAKANNFVEAGSWRSVLNIVDPPAAKQEDGTLVKARAALAEASKEGHLPPSLNEPASRLVTHLLSLACRAHVTLSQLALAKPTCSALLAVDPDSVWALVHQGEEQVAAEEWEEAVRTLTRAFELGGKRDADVLERVKKAQKGLKVSKQKDYYKVLGVPRDADTRTLKKAYRKASKFAHPDKGGSEAKMTALNEAYEILSNPELRARYDAGDDPNDTSRQQHHAFHAGAGAHPIFQQFFQQAGGGGGFGGGGHTFSFRFG